MYTEIRICESCGNWFERLSSAGRNAAAQTSRQIIQEVLHQTETDYEFSYSGIFKYLKCPFYFLKNFGIQETIYSSRGSLESILTDRVAQFRKKCVSKRTAT